MPATTAKPRVFPKATLVLFVRHAVTPTTGKVLPGRAPGLHLSAEGERQAEAVAKRIAGVPGVKAVYASPWSGHARRRRPSRPRAGCA